MTRLSRITTIWRKELRDTLRDRRTLIAMILVPMVLYPAMILGSLQGFELQISRLQQEEYRVGVQSEEVRAWLRQLIDSHPARLPGAASQPAEVLVERADRGELPPDTQPKPSGELSTDGAARAAARQRPPQYALEVIPHPEQLLLAVKSGQLHAAVIVADGLPTATGGSARVTLLMDQTEIRSQFAVEGLKGIFDRAAEHLLAQRLRGAGLAADFIQPIRLEEQALATPEKVGGSILGQIVPLILIIMTITGAIYPAIDLTAGERERGTLETLMVAPVPTVDLIAGKFVVVALIAMLSAALNLLSIGGTIWLGGLGDLLAQGGQVIIPLGALPWVLLVLVPVAVMFSAALLAVCSFARSFKEAQNYVMPVMVAAMIPAVIGVLPGMQLEGPLLIMPVTNIVILCRDLFTGKFNPGDILWVTLSTSLYAGAAVAVAARLFGQEAVLFADSGSVRTLFQRRFFKPADRPTAAQALLLLAVLFSANFFAQQQLLRSADIGTHGFWQAWSAILFVLMVLVPLGAAVYLRARVGTTFALARPPPAGWAAALCFALSTWVLAQAWLHFQGGWLKMDPQIEQALRAMEERLNNLNVGLMLYFLALVPAFCEEFLFRGYALSGLRSSLGKPSAILITALAFAVNHHMVQRLVVTFGLGLLFGLLVVQYRSIWPAMLAHFGHNALSVLAARPQMADLLDRLHLETESGAIAAPWVIGTASLAAVGVAVCLLRPRREKFVASGDPIGDDPGWEPT